MNRIALYIIFIILISIFGCNLEQEIEVDLPDFEERPAVECYLEPGQPFTLLLTKSVAYFDPFPSFYRDEFLDAVLENDAQVSIIHNQKVYTLENELVFNPFTRKVFNYVNRDFVPSDFENDFELKIVTKDGKTIEAKTRILRPIPIDSVVVQFPETLEKPGDTLARVLTYLTDPPGVENYFRRLLNVSSLDSIPEQDFIADDKLIDKNVIAFGTAYDYAKGDTIYNTIYHIDQAYFEFLESLFRARAANGNPFAQPSPVISNVRGTANAIGIFTFLSYNRKVTIIK